MNKRFQDYSHQRFDKLVALSCTRRPFPNGGQIRTFWLCQCDCGNVTEVCQSSLKRKGTKSCGCLKHIGYTITHGLSKSSTYKIWSGIKKRCLNVKSPGYKKYGAKGIKICDRWKNDFLAFLEDVGERPEGLTIERKDPKGDYTPENCKWATWEEQATNRKNSIRVVVNGIETCLRNACTILNLPYKKIHKEMLKRGLSGQEILDEYIQLKLDGWEDEKIEPIPEGFWV